MADRRAIHISPVGCLVLVPPGLVTQWQEELRRKLRPYCQARCRGVRAKARGWRFFERVVASAAPRRLLASRSLASSPARPLPRAERRLKHLQVHAPACEPMRSYSSYISAVLKRVADEHVGVKTQRATAIDRGALSFRWLRGPDLNQRPLGYEPFSIQDWSPGATNNAS